MLKSLEKLRNICDNSPLSKGSILGDQVEVSCRHLADEIQAEVDERYMPKTWDVADLEEHGVDPIEISKAADMLRRNGSLDTYIEKFYLHRPTFEDGEPVQVGDYVDLQCEGKRRVQVTGLEAWIVYGSSTCHQRTPYKRPPEPDTQEKIDMDCSLNAIDYCDKYHIDRVPNPMAAARLHLLARQRKLDGVE